MSDRQFDNAQHIETDGDQGLAEGFDQTDMARRLEAHNDAAHDLMKPMGQREAEDSVRAAGEAQQQAAGRPHFAGDAISRGAGMSMADFMRAERLGQAPSAEQLREQMRQGNQDFVNRHGMSSPDNPYRTEHREER
jgi:hypothetical protein